MEDGTINTTAVEANFEIKLRKNVTINDDLYGAILAVVVEQKVQAAGNDTCLQGVTITNLLYEHSPKD